MNVRTHAVCVMYQLLQNEYELEKDLNHLQMQLTMSLSKMTEKLRPIGEKCLQQSIQALLKLNTTVGLTSSKPTSEASLDFGKKFTTLLQRLTTILGDSMEISRQSKLGQDADSATSENLLLQVADAFSHIPEIKIEWLSRLANHHAQQSNYAEAAQCYVMMSTLARTKSVEESIESTDKLVISYYEQCVKLLDKAELYEQCSDIYHLLIPLYHKYRDYKSLSNAHLHLHHVFEKLIEANKNQTRMLGTYYRIGFYGRRFGERLNGNEFVYKCPKITRLSEIASQMKQRYSNQLGVPVRILPDSNPVDPTKLDPEECIMQVTFVNAYFEPITSSAAENNSNSSSHHIKLRNTFIDQSTDLASFKFSTPFTAAGKTYATNVSEQQKRNTVLYVPMPFPCILTAQQISRRQETILSPIESATEDIILRTNTLLEQLISDNLNQKTLTGLLAGSVATQVHGGAKEVCMAFLSPAPGSKGADKDDEDDDVEASPTNTTGRTLDDETNSSASSASSVSSAAQEKLREAMRKFLDACQKALDANKKLCVTDTDKEFQANLDQQFDEMCASIQSLIVEQPKKTKGKNKKKGAVRFG